MEKNFVNICFINYLNDYVELDYFVRLILDMDFKISKRVNLFIATSAQLHDDAIYLFQKVNSLKIFEDYKSIEFQGIIKNMDLGIVPSLLEETMSQSSIEFLSNDVPILCGLTGGDHELSESELFRFENEIDFQNKFENLINNPQLLSEYKKNYSEFTEQYIKECKEEDLYPIKVSVIVPFYNSEDYIDKCVKSLINQTLKNIEILLVDDGSTDKSLLKAKFYEKEDSRVKVLTQKHSKQGAARNLGMLFAKGEYIGFVDSDDWIDLDFFEKLYRSAKRHDSDIALGTNIRIGNGKTKKRLNITKEQFYRNIQDRFIVCNQFNNECPTNKIYKTTLLKSNHIEWPEGIYCEDKLFTTKTLYYANGVVSVPNANYYYYRNPNSTVNRCSQKHSIVLLEDKNNAKKSVVEFLRAHNVNFADKKYWAIQRDISIGSIPIIRIKESLFTKRFYLFSFICIGEMAL